MNKVRRKQLAEILDQIHELTEQLEALGEEEQEAYDNMPEGLQEGERGELMVAAVENIGNAVDALGEACEFVEAAKA